MRHTAIQLAGQHQVVNEIWLPQHLARHIQTRHGLAAQGVVGHGLRLGDAVGFYVQQNVVRQSPVTSDGLVCAVDKLAVQHAKPSTLASRQAVLLRRQI